MIISRMCAVVIITITFTSLITWWKGNNSSLTYTINNHYLKHVNTNSHLIYAKNKILTCTMRHKSQRKTCRKTWIWNVGNKTLLLETCKQTKGIFYLIHAKYNEYLLHTCDKIFLFEKCGETIVFETYERYSYLKHARKHPYSKHAKKEFIFKICENKNILETCDTNYYLKHYKKETLLDTCEH